IELAYRLHPAYLQYLDGLVRVRRAQAEQQAQRRVDRINLAGPCPWGAPRHDRMMDEVSLVADAYASAEPFAEWLYGQTSFVNLFAVELQPPSPPTPVAPPASTPARVPHPTPRPAIPQVRRR